jgi:hypothetical protein
MAKVAGGIWMIAGMVFGALKTRGFRTNFMNFDIPE